MVDSDGKLVCCILCENFWNRKSSSYVDTKGNRDRITDKEICKECMKDDGSCTYKNFKRQKKGGE